MSCRLQQYAHFFPSYRPLISSALGNIFAALEANEDAIVASLTAGHEIFSQMIRADELRNEWQTNVNHLDSVFRGHLAEYNGLLRPIVAEFKRVSMEFSAAIKPQVDILRGEFWSNTEETITAMGPVAHTVMKMARNLRESATEYARDYTTELQNMYSNIEQLSPEEKARKRERMNEIGQEIMLKFQELYGVANGAPAQS